MQMNSNRPLILASTSTTRRELLRRLALPFECIAPEVDESAQAGETPSQLAYRLAEQKAAAVAQQHPDAWVIGSDQVASQFDLVTGQAFGALLGKPLTDARAIAQLQQFSGQTLRFYTGVSLQCAAIAYIDTAVVEFSVTFRALTLAEIQRYVALEQPLYCAGSFKCEGLGITLFEQMQGEDLTALMGLPLLRLCQMLRQVGYALP
jgi:MAF protein